MRFTEDDEVPGEDGYRGTVQLQAAGWQVEVAAELRGAFEPISGRYQWYGRLAADQQVTELASRHARGVTLRTSYGAAVTTLNDVDPWGRYRVSGTGRPPFEVRTSVPSDAG